MKCLLLMLVASTQWTNAQAATAATRIKAAAQAQATAEATARQLRAQLSGAEDTQRQLEAQLQQQAASVAQQHSTLLVGVG